MAHPALSHRAAVRTPWARFLPPVSGSRAFRWRPTPGVAERSGGFARGRASTPIRTWSARARAPPPGSPGATTDTDRPHTRRVRQTSLPRHSSGRSTERPSGSSSSTTLSVPARPFRLARVPRPGMTNTDVRLGTHPQDRTRQGPRSAQNTTSRTLSRTDAHASDADDNRAVGVATLARRSFGRPLSPGPLRNGVELSCGVDERRAAGTLPGAAQGRRIPDPVPSASRPQIAATAVERRGPDAPGVAGTVPGVAGCLAGIACGSATAELLEQVCDLDLSVLEAVELPRGFGRDG